MGLSTVHFLKESIGDAEDITKCTFQSRNDFGGWRVLQGCRWFDIGIASKQNSPVSETNDSINNGKLRFPLGFPTLEPHGIDFRSDNY